MSANHYVTNYSECDDVIVPFPMSGKEATVYITLTYLHVFAYFLARVVLILHFTRKYRIYP